jgi:glucose/arabinose dehydrogenase
MNKFILISLLAPMAWAAPKKPQLLPTFDPPDQLFRMAPMPQSSRSIVVPLSNTIHLAFDTELCRIHTVWKGGPLKLFGPCYHGGKRPFICLPNGNMLWGNMPFTSWHPTNPGHAQEIERGRQKLVRYLGVRTESGRIIFIYNLINHVGGNIRIEESVRAEGDVVVRQFKIWPRKTRLFLNAHQEFGKKIDLGIPNTAAIKRGKDVLLSVVRGKGAEYLGIGKGYIRYTEETFTEEGSTKGNPTQILEGSCGFLTLFIEASEKPTTFLLASMVAANTDKARQMARTWKGKPVVTKPPKPVIREANPRARRSFVLSPYYTTEAFALPKKLNLQVTGMDWLAKDKLAVCTYAGEVWIVEDATGPVGQMKFRRFARGMNEPMGVLVKDGKIHLGNKAEITRLSDTDKDGAADLFECVNRDWDYTGSYNSFSYGPVLDKNGNFVVANAGHAGRWSARHMGWALRIKPGSAKAEAFASGFREPNGIGTFGPDKDIFVTDNQGAWIGACKLNHVKDGGFYGHPASKPAPKKLYAGRKTFTPPAVWFPYKLARSSSGMCEIKDDRFGPFKGQLLVGDFQNAIVTRVQLEKVGGEWQGAVWPFLKGFQSGVNRLLIGPDGHLYVGGCKTVAWAANAPFSQGLERVKFSGKIPFEVKTVRAIPDGFELTFTKPVDPKATGDAAGYDVWQYKYLYQKKYGSPEFDHDGKKDSFTVIDVKSATVSKDGLKVRLRLDGWKAGYVTAVRGLNARSAEGEKLWNDTFYYTLNRIPRR